jgi:hypothetical protein
LSVCTLRIYISCVFDSSAMYVKYIQNFFQSWLVTADHALLVTISSKYHSSLDTWTVIQMTATKFKPFIFSVRKLKICITLRYGSKHSQRQMRMNCKKKL